MKHGNPCPKCHGTDIIRAEVRIRANGAGDFIQVGWTNLSAVLVHRYVCCTCGYCEEWIDEGDLPALKKAYR